MFSDHASSAEDVERVVSEPLAEGNSADSRVVTALDMLRSAAARRERLRIQEIGGVLGIDPTHLGRLIRGATGFGFTEWRTGYLLRRALPALADSEERVQQIACRLLGYEHQAQFSEEFKRFFGLSPTVFRGMARQVRLNNGMIP